MISSRVLTVFLALSEALKVDQGFNVESRAIRNLIEIMVQYDGPVPESVQQDNLLLN